MDHRLAHRIALAAQGAELFLMAEVSDSLLTVTQAMTTLNRLYAAIDSLPEASKEALSKELGDTWKMCAEELAAVVSSLELISYVAAGVHRKQVRPHLDAKTQKQLDTLVKRSSLSRANLLALVLASSQLPGDEKPGSFKPVPQGEEALFQFPTFNDGGTGYGDRHIPDQYAPQRSEDGAQLAKTSPENPQVVTDWSDAKPQYIRPNIPKTVRR